MSRFFAIASIAFASVASPAFGATVSVSVRTANGRPVDGAVVTIEAPGVAAPRPQGGYSVEQRDIAFQPGIVIVPVGATVTFPNRDRVRHHVYSFSRPKRFDLKLYGREESRSVTFEKPGVVALGCNIHDRMNGVVFVTATPFAARAAGGRAVLNGVPAGPVTVRVWHPSIRAPGNSMARPVTVPAGGGATTIVIGK